MSKILKRLNDNQNKVADTNGIMKLQAWDDGVAQDLTNKKITATVANASGFLFDLDLVSNGTEIDLDFKDSQLQKLTPDTYFLEIKVTDKDGDVSVFPTEGYAIFIINKNLHATEGELVPQITFDTVLADVKKAVDEKVTYYTSTIAKGDKGDKGDPGKDADMPVIGGRNLLLGSKLLTSKVLINNSTFEILPYDSNTNMWHITAPKGGSSSVGIYFLQTGNVSNTITEGQQWAFSFDIKGTGVYSAFGIEWSSSFNKPLGNIPTDWTRVSSTGVAAGTSIKPVIIYFNSVNVALDVYVKLPKLEVGNVATDWTPAPEDVPSNDTQLVHNTGNETIAGNKTFTGSTSLATTTILAGNYGLRVTPSGFQKTTDGQTWVSANI